jgi:hypothetical protein
VFTPGRDALLAAQLPATDTDATERRDAQAAQITALEDIEPDSPAAPAMRARSGRPEWHVATGFAPVTTGAGRWRGSRVPSAGPMVFIGNAEQHPAPPPRSVPVTVIGTGPESGAPVPDEDHQGPYGPMWVLDREEFLRTSFTFGRTPARYVAAATNARTDRKPVTPP